MAILEAFKTNAPGLYKETKSILWTAVLYVLTCSARFLILIARIRTYYGQDESSSEEDDSDHVDGDSFLPWAELEVKHKGTTTQLSTQPSSKMCSPVPASSTPRPLPASSTPPPLPASSASPPPATSNALTAIAASNPLSLGTGEHSPASPVEADEGTPLSSTGIIFHSANSFAEMNVSNRERSAEGAGEQAGARLE